MSFESETDTDLIRHGPDREPPKRWTQWVWNVVAAVIAALGIALLLQPYAPPPGTPTSQVSP